MPRIHALPQFSGRRAAHASLGGSRFQSGGCIAWSFVGIRPPTKVPMRTIVLLASTACALMACAEKSPWTVEQADLYRVSDYDEEPHAAQAGPRRQFFLVKKVVAAPDSALKDVVQFQVVWCEKQNTCTDRDYSLQVDQFRGDREDERTTFQSGANCTIVKHSLAGDRMTIQSDTYASNQFTAAECKAGLSTPLPPKFIRTSRRTISGELVRPAKDLGMVPECRDRIRHPISASTCVDPPRHPPGPPSARCDRVA